MIKQLSLLHAIKWSYSASWGERALGALITVVLAAALGPREFGMIAMGLVYISFAQMCLEQGFVAALIQRKNLLPLHLDTVFWMTLVLSIALMGITGILSPWWAAINHVPDVSKVIRVLSLSIVIEALSIVQVALLKRAMDFRSLSIRSNASVLAGGVAGFAMAWSGCGVWALVGQQLARDLTAVLLLWRFSAWRPRLRFSRDSLRELMGFSASNFLAQLGVFANGQAGVVVLGLLSGPIPVGLYRLAERVMNSVLAAAAASIQAVSLPEFSRRQDDPAQLRGSVISLVRLSCMVTLPALAGLSVVSPHLTLTMGSKWSPASPVLTVLCIVGMTQVFALFTGPLLQALNRPLQLAALEWARTLLSISTFALAGYLVRAASAGVQATGVALAQLATGALIVAPVYLFILAKLCNVGLVEIAGAVAPSATAAAVTAGVVVLLGSSGLVASQRPAAALAVEVVLGGASGILALVWLDRQVRHLVADIAHTVLGRRRCRVTSKGDRYSCKEEVR